MTRTREENAADLAAAINNAEDVALEVRDWLGYPEDSDAEGGTA